MRQRWILAGAVIAFCVLIAWFLRPVRTLTPSPPSPPIASAYKLDEIAEPVQGPAPAATPGEPEEKHAYTNRLSRETSPYLLMHAHNPVDWYPWGEEAFRKARRENKPIFLSVGYAACHWCLVMERESFSDPAIAEIMNRHYVSIKLDREERPDIDRVYLLFLQLTTGGSGYPMTLFLTPDLKPILGGTYFPRESTNGIPALGSFLTQFAEAWDKDRDNVIKAANNVTEALRGHIGDQLSSGAKVDSSILREGYDRIAAQYDSTNGGFGGKPKYPQPVIFNFLLRHYARTGQQDALSMTLYSLRKIAEGGIHDHLSGGFFRYSTDTRWQVPHFEKMLYDQAQLAVAYLDAYQITREPSYAQVARGVLEYVLRELKSPEGAFYSAQSADSLYEEGKPKMGEGAVYVWEAKSIQEALGPEVAPVFAFRYGVEPEGNVPSEQDIQGELKGRNVLYVKHSVGETASQFAKTQKDVEAVLAASSQKLLAVRTRRPQPAKDDKVIAAWNGLMISSLARAAQVLDDPRYERAAATTAAFLRTTLYDSKSGTLKRRYRAGNAAVDGFLDDYAFLIQGLLDLYETSFDVQWLSWAVRLQDKQDEAFWDREHGTYFATTTRDSSVLFRMRDEFDGAEPSANSVAAMNLLRLSQLTDNAERKSKAEAAFGAFANRLQQSPDVLPQLMAALDFGLSKPKQIIIAGKRNAPDTRALLRLVHERYIPNKFLVLADGGDSQRQIAKWLPFVDAMRPRDNKATAYICEDYVCRLPSADLKVVADLLDGKN
jgi:uncharacterized protein